MDATEYIDYPPRDLSDTVSIGLFTRFVWSGRFGPEGKDQP